MLFALNGMEEMSYIKYLSSSLHLTLHGRRREKRGVEHDGLGQLAEGEGGHYHAEGTHHFAEPRGGEEEEDEQVLLIEA